MRERRHNRPIDIAATAVARARREYDSSVPIILSPLLVADPWWQGNPKVASTPLKADMMIVGFDAANPDLTLVEFKTTGTAQYTAQYKVATAEDPLMPLIVRRSSIETLNSFQEPQPNGANLVRWEVGYWCERTSPLSNPNLRLLTCERGRDNWVSFYVRSFSKDTRRDELAYIKAWGYS